MTPAARFAALMELTDLLLAEWQLAQPRPAELVLKAYTQQRRYIGGGDRRALQESLFALLRRFGVVKARCEASGLPVNGRSLALLFAGEEAAALCTGGNYAPLPLQAAESRVLGAASSDTLHPASCDLPPWLDTLLRQQYGEETDTLIAALMQPAPVDLRVNRLKATRDEAQRALAAEGIETKPIEGLPDALEAPRQASVTQTKPYLQGWVEIQDRGSQAVIHCLLATLQTEQVRGGESPGVWGDSPFPTIIDYCAGAGGKSLALASLLRNAAKILAWDIDAKRLSQLPLRAGRAGASITRWEVSPEKLPQAEVVLLDVPCSGTGTIRRHPDLPWRLTPEKLEEYRQLQKTILRRGAQLVKPGGFLCYVTCSLLESENFQCVNDFLSNDMNFRVVTCAQMWDKGAAKNALSLQFLPHNHQSDGFYSVLLQREF